MTIAEADHAIAELPGGPWDLDFFFDPGCPFAWQTSVWIRRVVELRGIKVGWRFISLKHINDANEVPAAMRDAQMIGLRFHRICAAARERLGNDAVGALYKAFGERMWYTDSEQEAMARFADAAKRIDPAEILDSLQLPADLREAADDDSWDAVIFAESDEAFRRTGPDVGTPIISYDPPHGNALFGPVISSVPEDDATVLAMYDALRTFVDYPGFSELKRSARAAIDLPLFH
jgi:hypothetical protein